MNNPAFPDLGDLWRDLLRQWEDAGNSLGTDAMKRPEFGKFMNQATSSSAAMQRVFADLSASYLAALNLPTNLTSPRLPNGFTRSKNELKRSS